MTCLGVLDRGERGDDNGTSLKEERGIEMTTTVLHSRCTLLRFIYLHGAVIFLEKEKMEYFFKGTSNMDCTTVAFFPILR